VSHDYLLNAKTLLMKLKPYLQPQQRVVIAEALLNIERYERQSPPDSLSDWCRRFAPSWNPSGRNISLMRLFLANGQVHRDEIAWVIGRHDQPASDVAVRAHITRLRNELERSCAMASIAKAGRDGQYSTHQIKRSIQTLMLDQ